MQFYPAERIGALIPISDLIDAIEREFLASHVIPPRLVAKVPGGGGDRLFLGMPAFDIAGGAAIKLTMLYPDNRGKGLPVNQAVIVVFGENGEPAAMLDGTIITHLRTSAASALASRYLSREDSRHLLVVGTGALAPHMAIAHCSVRPIDCVSLWGRNEAHAQDIARKVRAKLDSSIEVQVCSDLATTVPQADIVSCATSAAEPIVQGKWLKPGTFVDLVGSFSPTAREVDDDVVRTARLFVDTFAGALEEAGDILEPMSRGVIGRDDLAGELADLISGKVQGRRSAAEITLFKSVGTAIEDLAAAKLIVASAGTDPL